MMKRFLSILSWALLLAVVLCVPVALAADTEPQEVQVQFTSKKKAYEPGEEIRLSLTVQNNFGASITNVSAGMEAPEGYSLPMDELPSGITLGSGKKASFSFSLVPGNTEQAAHNNNLLLFLLIGVAVVLIGVAVFWIIRKKLPARSAVCLLLVVSMLGSFGVMPVQAQSMGPRRYELLRSLEITVDGKPVTLSLSVCFDYDPHGEDLAVDLAEFGYREELEAFVVPSGFKQLTGTLKEPTLYTELSLVIRDQKGNLLSSQTVPAAENWQFSNVGLCPGINEVQITAVGSTGLSARFRLYDPYLTHYPLLEGAETDTDGDGLYDLLEGSMGTDPQKADTDGDGLTDTQEISVLFTDPTNADSNGNGVPDGSEDFDGDGLTDGKECSQGLSPILRDTDRDGISDFDELNRLGTDPVKADTDGDGADDGWETEQGYSPYYPNATFNLSCKTSDVSEANPVSASAAVVVSGLEADVESLEVLRVSTADSPFLSQTIAGYLGQAVDFHLDGSFQSATLTFHYDTSLGTVGPEFQPRIYYLNETTGELEELPNQTVYNGTVIAQTSHFSIYILLDSIALNKAYSMSYEELSSYYINVLNMPERVLATLGSADIAMVLDRSASMAWNDSQFKQGEVARYFLGHVRPGYDQVALLAYTKEVQLLQGLTRMHHTLVDTLGDITLDNGVGAGSGTDGAAALDAAIELLEQGSGSYRYLLFFSDGDDATLAARSQELIQKALDRDIRLICVGINTGAVSVLADLATGTNGKYLCVWDQTDVPALCEGLLEVFDAITPNETDSNQDGLSDYVTKLIHDGKIPLQNGSYSLAGLDLSCDVNGRPSDDWDGDGAKNGEELTLVFKNNRAYLSMKSDPRLPDTDLDGFTDGQELAMGTSPTQINLCPKAVDVITNSKLYYLHEMAQYEEDYLPENLRWLTDIRDGLFDFEAFIFDGGAEKRTEVYWESFAYYYTEYGADVVIDDVETQELQNFVIDVLDALLASLHLKEKTEAIGTASKVTAPLDQMKTLHQMRHQLIPNANMTKDAYKKLCSEKFGKYLDEILDGLKNKPNVKWNRSEVVQKLLERTKKYTKNVGESLEDLGDISKISGFVSDGLEIYEMVTTFARINADSQVFLANLEALEYVRDHSKDEFAAAAAETLILQLSDSFWTKSGVFLIRLLEEALQIGVARAKDALVKYAVEVIPVVGTFVAVTFIVIDLVDLFVGVSAEIEATYKMLCFHEISKAYTALIEASPVTQKGKATPTDYRNVQFYYQNLAQVHIAGETEYLNYFDISTGLLTWLRWEELKESVSTKIARLETARDAIRDNKEYREPNS